MSTTDAQNSGAYTHLNLESLEDSAAKHGFGETGESRFATGDLDAAETGLAHHRLKAGKRQSFGHRHEQAEEVCVVLAGSGRVKLDDEIVELTRLDAIRLAPAVSRQFEAGPDGLEYLVFGPHYKRDGEILPGWWVD
jgi:mannose-6-phosphate isomerase-like protein (cupin superfamily)